jgi:hypothetical protein
MSFLNPLILFGLVAAAIPLIIHLFNLRRPRRIDFSSLVFLRELQRSTMRRVRIRQWILLLLRTLALASLILAFARPTLRGPLAGVVGSAARTSAAIVLDNSLSMTLRDRQGEYLRQARDFGLGIVDGMGSGDELILALSAGPAGAGGEPFRSMAAARDVISAVSPEAGSRPLGAAVAAAVDGLMQSTQVNRELYVISDLQRSTFVDSLRIEVPPDVRTFLVPVGSGTRSNIAVSRVEVVSRIVEVGQPVRVDVEVSNYGTRAVQNYMASVYLGDDRVAQQSVDLSPGAGRSVTFTVTPQQSGWLAGRVEIEDDEFSGDNTRFFVLEVPERRRVALVVGKGQPADHIGLALSPLLVRGRVAFEVVRVEEASFSATALQDFDAVLLAGLSEISSGDAARLAAYVQEGKGIILFPSWNGDYDALFEVMRSGRYDGSVGDPGLRRTVARLERADLEHPLFEGVFREEDRRIDIERPDVFALRTYRAGSGDEQPVISLSTGTPFLQEVRFGSGVVFISAVAADPGWSDFPVSGLFVPLLYRTVFYLASGEPGGERGLEVGRASGIRIAGSVGTSLVLVGPDGEEVVPEQRPQVGGMLLQVPSSLRVPGIYQVQSQTGTLMRRVAVNIPVQESDLAVLSAGDARDRLSRALDGPVSLLRTQSGPDELRQAIEAERFGVELWNVFLMLALSFLIAEMAVAMRWRPESA